MSFAAHLLDLDSRSKIVDIRVPLSVVGKGVNFVGDLLK